MAHGLPILQQARDWQSQILKANHAAVDVSAKVAETGILEQEEDELRQTLKNISKGLWWRIVKTTNKIDLIENNCVILVKFAFIG